MFDTSDTIAAVASGGGALRGIIRLSGPAAIHCLSRVFAPEFLETPLEAGPSRVVSGAIRLSSQLGEIPCDVYLWPTQRSYTRQPCCEIHTLGSAPLLDALLGSLCQAGARLAQPGEFTLRAFLAGRMDLTQAEAVLGVIDSRSTLQLNGALKQLAGGLARPLNTLRDQLLDLLARLEAGLDFVEEDIEFISGDEMNGQLVQVHETITGILAQMTRRTHHSETPRVVLRGYPNVGKSSLFNALSQCRRSIVSPAAGTTRDYVTNCINLDGRMVTLIDTAGIDTVSNSDRVAAAAQFSASDQFEQATLQLLCLDSTRQLNSWERAELELETDMLRLVVLTKCDGERICEWQGPAVATSSLSGMGFTELSQAIAESLDAAAENDSGILATTASRCEGSLCRAEESVRRALDLQQRRRGDELVAAELRGALDELGLVVGAIYTDDILDRIFSRFCIGK